MTQVKQTRAARLHRHGEPLVIEDVALPATLRQAGVKHRDLEMLASDALLQQRLLVNNPREVTYADALAIYRAAFGEAA